MDLNDVLPEEAGPVFQSFRVRELIDKQRSETFRILRKLLRLRGRKKVTGRNSRGQADGEYSTKYLMHQKS